MATTTPPHRVRVAANVRAELARQGLRQVDAAAALGCSPYTFSRRLRAVTAFDVDELGQLAELLEVPTVTLFEGVA